MTNNCEPYRQDIARALLEDLDPARQDALKTHLAECPACREERELVVQTLEELRSTPDAGVPRHFFVYPEQRGFRAFFQRISFPWKTSVALASLILLVLGSFALLSFQFQVEEGIYSFSFGKPIPPRVAPVDVAALKRELIQTAEERARRQDLQWGQLLRSELSKSRSSLSPGQRASIAALLEHFESRVGRQMVAAGTGLEAKTSQSLADMYQLIQVQRRRDLTAIGDRFNRLTVSNQIQRDETDAILETLLQVAELKIQ